jgi:hypothetical protein
MTDTAYTHLQCALISTSADASTTDAIAFLLAHKSSHQERLPFTATEEEGNPLRPVLDLSFVGEPWWPLIAPEAKPIETPKHIMRRWFELCVLTQVMQELKSADLCVPGSDRYSDFREQFVSDKECQQGLASYGEQGQSAATFGLAHLLGFACSRAFATGRD